MSDWQLGMTRHVLDRGTQEWFSQFGVVVCMAGLAADRDCAFAVVAGDVFDTNPADRRTVAKTLDAMAYSTAPA